MIISSCLRWLKLCIFLCLHSYNLLLLLSLVSNLLDCDILIHKISITPDTMIKLTSVWLLFSFLIRFIFFIFAMIFTILLLWCLTTFFGCFLSLFRLSGMIFLDMSFLRMLFRILMWINLRCNLLLLIWITRIIR
jgi:hypothetical protein